MGVRMPFFAYGTHTIEVKLGPYGEETVLYDGLMISHKKPYSFGVSHKFSVKEAGEEVNYEVKIEPKGGLFGAVTGIGKVLAPKVEVFRDGKKINEIK